MSRLFLLLLVSLQAAAPASLDPAAATFTSDAGLLVVSVKPDKTADYEEAIRALQDALAKASGEKHREIAKGWRVFKATDLDAKANAVYVHLLQPAVKGVDYDPVKILSEAFPTEVNALYEKLKGAYAALNKAGLTKLMDMSAAGMKEIH